MPDQRQFQVNGTAQEACGLRIFLSYGHDANEELVRRIKADLEQRGHDVWFDKNEIQFGDNWRRFITDGILNFVSDSHRDLEQVREIHNECKRLATALKEYEGFCHIR